MSMPSPYTDPEGKPRLRRSVTGFLDVLGFSHLSTKSTDPVESQKLLERISAAISDARVFARSTFSDQAMDDPRRWALKFFSDNLVFGVPTESDVVTPAEAAWFAIRCAQCYQLRMVMNGFFVRGALTEGDICLTDEIIFGSALIECYRLETYASIVPRVLLTKPLQELLARSAASGSREFPADAGDWICRDIDGWWFVNYLQAARTDAGTDWRIIERHKKSVLASLATTTDHDILPKFGWACRYHNVFCHWHRDDPGYADSYRIDRIDEQSTIHRLRDAI
jgi:hypothetical protein